METSSQWAIKYRPTKWEEVAGCASIKAMVEANLKTDKWPRSVLLMGKFGTGKTTSARLLAMTMACQHRDEKGNPCMTCPDCKAILEERYSRDVKRICAEDLRQDGGYTDGVANFVREAKTQPFFGRKKIIIFEEIQTILNAGNAKGAIDLLLRELENPNSKTYWIFTAMDTIQAPLSGARKAGPGGFLSRQVVHNFSDLNATDVLKYLYNLAQRIEWEEGEYKGNLWNYLVQNAGKEFCTNGLLEIAKGSAGSYRTATQMFQSCVETKTFEIPSIRAQFGLVEENILNDVLWDIAENRKTDKVLDLLSTINNTNYTELYYGWSMALKEAEMARVFGKVKITEKNKTTGKWEVKYADAKSVDVNEKSLWTKSFSLSKAVNYEKLKALFETLGIEDGKLGFNSHLFVMRILNCFS